MKKKQIEIAKVINCAKESAKDFFSTYDIAKLTFWAGLLFCGVFILDYLDIPSRVLGSIPREITIIVLVAATIVLIVWIFKLRYYELLWLHPANPIDAASFVVFVSLGAYAVVRTVVLGCKIYVAISGFLCGGAIVLMVVKLILRGIRFYKVESDEGELIDFKDLFENNYVSVPSKPIRVIEKDVDYDLLGREGVINQLYEAIAHCQPTQSYVISLEGEWGSGKTTIINNVNRILTEDDAAQKKYVCISDFDPWVYGSQEAVLSAMMESLLCHLGMHYSPSKISDMLKGVQEAVFDSHWSVKIVKGLSFDVSRVGEK